jgi:predicted phosphodiesterase
VRCLIISDIHANRVALDAVLDAAPAFDEIWCLGDIVGYGPDPNACIERLQEFPHICVLGNHDQAALGRIDLRAFNLDARLANAWTQEHLTQASRSYLEILPVTYEREDFYLVHGSPREPLWEYVLESHTAYANFAHFASAVCLVGHSHVPLLFRMGDTGQYCELKVYEPGQTVQLTPNRMLLNPGSVGQPRDGDSRSSYAMLDTKAMTWQWHRVHYNVEAVQMHMRKLEFPQRLIERLAVGR